MILTVKLARLEALSVRAEPVTECIDRAVPELLCRATSSLPKTLKSGAGEHIISQYYHNVVTILSQYCHNIIILSQYYHNIIILPQYSYRIVTVLALAFIGISDNKILKSIDTQPINI